MRLTGYLSQQADDYAHRTLRRERDIYDTGVRRRLFSDNGVRPGNRVFDRVQADDQPETERFGLNLSGRGVHAP